MILDIWQEIHPRQFWIELNVIYSVGKGVFWIECYLPGWEGYFTSFLLRSFINIKSLVWTSALFKYIFLIWGQLHASDANMQVFFFTSSTWT